MHFHSSHLRVVETDASAAILGRAQAHGKDIPEAPAVSPSLMLVLLFINELIKSASYKKIHPILCKHHHHFLCSVLAGSWQGRSGVKRRSLQGKVKSHLVVCCTQLVKVPFTSIHSHCLLTLIQHNAAILLKSCLISHIHMKN